MYSSALLVHLILLTIYGRTFCLSTSASQSQRVGLPSFSSTTVSTLSARTLGSQFHLGSYNHTNTTTPKPSYPTKIPDDPGKVCFIEDCGKYPNATKTVDQWGGSDDYVQYADLDRLCVLWNSSCTGSIVAARNEFFGNESGETLLSNECFQNQPTDPLQSNGLKGCYNIESSKTLLQFGQAKKWMRSPQCLANATQWEKEQPLYAKIPDLPHADTGAAYCCAKCDLSVQDVDIYYWPEVDVDVSCLDIIGDTSHPLDYGATTTSQQYEYIGRSSSSIAYETYWGCMGPDSSITTTAYITQINSITFKASSYNPWLPPPCTTNAPQAIAPKATTAASGEHASIRPRAHSLIIQTNITKTNGPPLSTLVLDDITL